MKLFIVRLENGNAVIMQAEDEREVLDSIGVTIDMGQKFKEHCERNHGYMKGNETEIDFRLALWNCGIGPQKVTVRELNHFACELNLTDKGDLELGGFFFDEPCPLDEIYQDYPYLKAAYREIDAQEDPHLNTPFAIQQLKEAVQRERTRLTFSGMDEAVEK